jgi:hypothetical protein
MAADLERLTRGTERDLQTLQVKLTYVGPQLKGRSSVVFTTFYHLLDMDWFRPLRRAGLSYANDDVDVWSFTVAPDEMTRVVATLARTEVVAAPRASALAHVSLMLVLEKSRLGDVAIEVILDAAQSAEVTDAILEALDSGNGVARTVMTLYKEGVAG